MISLWGLVRTQALLVEILILTEYTWWQNTDSRTERKGQLNSSAWVSFNLTLAREEKPVKQQWCICQGSRGDGDATLPQMTGSGRHDCKLELWVLPYCGLGTWNTHEATHAMNLFLDLLPSLHLYIQSLLWPSLLLSRPHTLTSFIFTMVIFLLLN